VQGLPCGGAGGQAAILILAKIDKGGFVQNEKRCFVRLKQAIY